MLFEIPIKNRSRLHEKKASGRRRDLASIVYPRSRLVGLEISHINATEVAAAESAPNSALKYFRLVFSSRTIFKYNCLLASYYSKICLADYDFELRNEIVELKEAI